MSCLEERLGRGEWQGWAHYGRPGQMTERQKLAHSARISLLGEWQNMGPMCAFGEEPVNVGFHVGDNADEGLIPGLSHSKRAFSRR